MMQWIRQAIIECLQELQSAEMIDVRAGNSLENWTWPQKQLKYHPLYLTSAKAYSLLNPSKMDIEQPNRWWGVKDS
jgi:hypothetical protein